MKLTPGQVVWYVPRNGNPRKMIVSKVGRKWASTEGRVDLKILLGTSDVHVPNFGKVGTIYDAQDVFASRQRLDAAWDDFFRDVRNLSRSRSEAVTVEDITAARRLLGLEVLGV